MVIYHLLKRSPLRLCMHEHNVDEDAEDGSKQCIPQHGQSNTGIAWWV